MKTNPITPTGIRKYGLTVAATIIEPTMFRITWVASRIAFGSNSSVALQKEVIVKRLIQLIYLQNRLSSLTQYLWRIDLKYVPMDLYQRNASLLK